jgi:hypothetical protein
MRRHNRRVLASAAGRLTHRTAAAAFDTWASWVRMFLIHLRRLLQCTDVCLVSLMQTVGPSEHMGLGLITMALLTGLVPLLEARYGSEGRAASGDGATGTLLWMLAAHMCRQPAAAGAVPHSRGHPAAPTSGRCASISTFSFGG